MTVSVCIPCKMADANADANQHNADENRGLRWRFEIGRTQADARTQKSLYFYYLYGLEGSEKNRGKGDEAVRRTHEYVRVKVGGFLRPCVRPRPPYLKVVPRNPLWLVVGGLCVRVCVRRAAYRFRGRSATVEASGAPGFRLIVCTRFGTGAGWHGVRGVQPAESAAAEGLSRIVTLFRGVLAGFMQQECPVYTFIHSNRKPQNSYGSGGILGM